MSERRRLLDLIVLWSATFILSKAVFSYIFDRPWPPTEGNVPWDLTLAICYVALVLVLIPWFRETLFVLRRNLALVAMVLLALLSSLWAHMPDLVLRKSIGLYGATLLGVALAVRASFDDQLRLLSWLFRSIGVLSLAFVVLLPGLAITEEGQWMGAFEHKNAMGSMLGLGALVEWQRPTESRGAKILKILALVLYAVLIMHSDSVTPSVVLVGAVFLIESYKLAALRLRLPKYAYFLGISLVLVLGLTFVLTNGDSLMGMVGRSSNLTGRTEIWGLTLSFVPQKPILGYGYSGFWLGASPESFVINRIMRGWIMYSHNGLLEQQLNLGIVGLALTLIFLGIGVKRALRLSEHRQFGAALWPLAFLFYFILHNTVECTIMVQDIEWALCVSCIAGADPLVFSFHVQEEDEIPLLSMEEPT